MHIWDSRPTGISVRRPWRRPLTFMVFWRMWRPSKIMPYWPWGPRRPRWRVGIRGRSEIIDYKIIVIIMDFIEVIVFTENFQRVVGIAFGTKSKWMKAKKESENEIKRCESYVDRWRLQRTRDGHQKCFHVPSARNNSKPCRHCTNPKVCCRWTRTIS